MEKTVGGRIRRLRQNQFKGQREVADALDISVPAYSKIETGITEVTIPRLRQIAAYYGVEPEELLNDERNDFTKEIEALKGQLKEVSDYCIILQRKLIATYEELEVVRGKGE